MLNTDIIFYKQLLVPFLTKIVAKDKYNRFICPFCGSGSYIYHTSAFCVDKEQLFYYCHRCGEHGDIFILVKKLYGLDRFWDQLQYLKRFYNCSENSTNITKSKVLGLKPITTNVTVPQLKEEQCDYSSYFAKVHSNIENCNYWRQRGLSLEIVKRFKLGFDPYWNHPKSKHLCHSPRLIIPTSNNSYLARDIRPEHELNINTRKFTKQKVGKVQIFNKNVFFQRKSYLIFIVEGEIDALSIIELGFDAIALGSVSNVNALLQLLKFKSCDKSFILALDNDRAGIDTTAKLTVELNKLEISYYTYALYGNFKDANECLVKDRRAFKLRLQTAVEQSVILDQYKRGFY